MLNLETNIAQKFETGIMREEYNAVSDDLFFSFSNSVEVIDAYAELLRNALLKDVFQSKQQRANIIKFLAKLQTQKELLEFATDSKKMEEAQKAAISFAKKSSINL